MEGRYVWRRDQPNLLLPEHQGKIEAAFRRGIVFGNHVTWIGSAPSPWAFRHHEQFMEYVSHSQPGDLYEIWSLPEL